MTAMLAINHLTKTYEGFRLGPLDLSVGEEVLAVLGPSGCGKTTLLSLIAGIAAPEDGSISLDGRALVGRPPEDRSTGLVFQDGALFPHMTARENVVYAAERDRIEELSGMLEIADVLDQRTTTLSGGEKQRVALARALAADPDALLLDEPLTNLDAPIRRRLRDELHELFTSLSIPVVYVTHDQRAATALGDRIAVLQDGSIEQVGPPSEILERPATPFVASFTGSENVFEADVVGRESGEVRLSVGDVRLRAAGDAAIGASVTGCVRPARVRLIGRAGDASSSSDPADADDSGSGGPNVLTGTVRRWIHEGDTYRVAIGVGGRAFTLLASIQSATFERSGIERDAAVEVSVPPDAIHLIEDRDD